MRQSRAEFAKEVDGTPSPRFVRLWHADVLGLIPLYGTRPRSIHFKSSATSENIASSPRLCRIGINSSVDGERSVIFDYCSQAANSNALKL